MVETPTFRATHVLEYPHTRTVGPVIGRFFTNLRKQRIEGVKTKSGRVIVPPVEYDPETAEPLEELVEVADCGEVVSWTWSDKPRATQPLADRARAWALIRLDGADTALLHVVDVGGDEAMMKTGMRVKVRWAPERIGDISDIACFVPEDAPDQADGDSVARGGDETVRSVRRPVRLEYDFVAPPSQATFLEGMERGVFVGQRCPKCKKVFMGIGMGFGGGVCPVDVEPLGEALEVSDKGTVVMYSTVEVPLMGADIPTPYISASVLLDGTDSPVMTIIREVEIDQVRQGMRVQAVWLPPDQLHANYDSVQYFRPIDEPDVELKKIKEHL